MADKFVTVRPSGQGGTYTSLVACQTGEYSLNPNLITMQGKLYIDIEGDWTGTPDSNTANFSSFTTNSDYNIIISVNATNYELRGKIELAQYSELSNMIVRTPTNVDRSIVVARYSHVVNCVAIGAEYSAFHVYGNSTVYNCIGINSARYGFEVLYVDGSVSNNGILKNCYAGGNVGADYELPGSNWNTGTNNVSEDSSGQITSVPFSTSTFTNVTTYSEDFSLPDGSSLIGAGTNLSSDSLYPFNYDIDGDTRVSWDVGVECYRIDPVGTSTTTQVRQTNSGSGSIYYHVGDIFTILGNTSLYAKWEESGSGTITGTLTGTPKVQTGNGSGSLSYSGILDSIQDKQTGTGVSTLSYSGILDSIQDRQTGTGVASLSYSGTLTTTQDRQTGAGSGSLGYSGNGTSIQDLQTNTGSGSLSYSGTVVGTQIKQTNTGSGSVIDTGIVGTITGIQLRQTGTGSGSVEDTSITGTGTGLQEIQTGTGSGTLSFTGTIHSVQDTQGNNGTGVQSFSGSIQTIQDAQAGTGLGTILIEGFVQNLQRIQETESIGVVVNYFITGTSESVQAVQTTEGTGNRESNLENSTTVIDFTDKTFDITSSVLHQLSLAITPSIVSVLGFNSIVGNVAIDSKEINLIIDDRESENSII